MKWIYLGLAALFVTGCSEKDPDERAKQDLKRMAQLEEKVDKLEETIR